MSDNSWVLRGVDPEARQAAVAEAERRGLTLADFLTEVLLLGPDSPVEQLAGEMAAEADTLLSAPPPSRENLAFRRRIEALERRLASAVGGLEAAVQELDAALIGTVARLDEAEAVTGETAEALHRALSDLGGHIGALRKRLTDLEDGAEALGEANDAAHADLDDRCTALEAKLAQVDAIARGAAAAEATLNAAYGALQQAVAQDFNAFADEQGAHLGAAVEHMRAIAESAARGADEASARAIEALRLARTELEARVSTHVEDTRAYLDSALEDVRLSALEANHRVDEVSRATAEALQTTREAVEQRAAAQAAEVQGEVRAALDDMRVFAYEATRRADEAAARAIDSLRATREAIETNVNAQAEELRARMHDAFADAADRLGGLTERVVDTEQAMVRSAQQLNTRITDIEDNTQRAIEATAHALRGELGAAAGHLRGELTSALADMMERRRADTARFNSIDATLTDTASDVLGLRAILETRLEQINEDISARQRQAALDAEARLAAIAERLGEAEQDTAHVRQSVSADLVRVETSVFASLEKLAQDIANAASAQQQAAAAQTAMLEAGLSEGRDQAAGVLARLRLVDAARLEAEQSLAALKDDIAGLSAATLQNETLKQGLAALEARVERDMSELRARSDQALRDLRAGLTALSGGRRQDETLAQKLEELRVRLTANEGQAAEAVDRAQGLARMMGRITAQTADVSSQTEDRLHKLEQVLAETDPGAQAAAHELNERLASFERRQADVLDGLRTTFAEFMRESERRLGEIEQHAAGAPLGDETLIANAIEARLTALEQADISAQLDALRHRVEERLTGLEGRSVRALEQVAETVAHIERRFHHGEDAAIARSA